MEPEDGVGDVQRARTLPGDEGSADALDDVLTHEWKGRRGGHT
jgi:hypothetical protein